MATLPTLSELSLNTVKCRGVLPFTVSHTHGSAPALRSSATTSLSSDKHATCRRVLPLTFRARLMSTEPRKRFSVARSPSFTAERVFSDGWRVASSTRHTALASLAGRLARQNLKTRHDVHTSTPPLYPRPDRRGRRRDATSRRRGRRGSLPLYQTARDLTPRRRASARPATARSRDVMR